MILILKKFLRSVRLGIFLRLSDESVVTLFAWYARSMNFVLCSNG